MQNLIREIPLSNGLTFRFFDATRRYFGDYHQVRIKITCEVPLSPEHFDNAGELAAAVKLVGDKVLYLKEIEHQGVPTEAVTRTVETVIKQFVDHSLGYFDKDSFPKKLVHSELNRARGKGRAFIGRANG